VPENESASRFGVVKTDENGRVVDFAYKPEQPESDLITTEVFVYNAARLLDVLDELANPSDSANALKDFGHELIPQLVSEGKAFEFRFDGYWRDVGTVDAYWQANMDLLEKPEELNLDDSRWAILTLAAQRVPAFVDASAEVKNCLIAGGTKIRGRVERSILSPGVIVEEGAIVRDSVVLHDAVIEKGATVFRAIIDNETRVKAGEQIGNEREITVIGKNGN
jgi:glucose-1-phosphate adenylyltransferase